jgi:hypothetical protein
MASSFGIPIPASAPSHRRERAAEQGPGGHEEPEPRHSQGCDPCHEPESVGTTHITTLFMDLILSFEPELATEQCTPQARRRPRPCLRHERRRTNHATSHFVSRVNDRQRFSPLQLRRQHSSSSGAEHDLGARNALTESLDRAAGVAQRYVDRPAGTERLPLRCVDERSHAHERRRWGEAIDGQVSQYVSDSTFFTIVS